MNIMRSASYTFYQKRAAGLVYLASFFSAVRSRKYHREDYHEKYTCQVSYHLINATSFRLPLRRSLVSLSFVHLYLYLNYYLVIIISMSSCVNRTQICIITCRSTDTNIFAYMYKRYRCYRKLVH